MRWKLLQLCLALLFLGGCGGSGSSGSSSGSGSSSTPPGGSSGNIGNTGNTGNTGNAGNTTPPANTEIRAVWLSRWYANSAAKIETCIDDMVAHNLNTLVLQVYGSGQALYASSVAPRSSLVSGNFDSMQHAVDYARGKGIKVHAWLNINLAWTGGSSYPAGHVVAQHPEWVMVKDNGLAMDLTDRPFFCPEFAGYRAYLVSLADELGSQYELDGLHLDYIRTPSDDYCYCQAHVDHFTQQYGRAPNGSDPDFIAFRFETISRTVREMDAAVKAHRPLCVTSAAARAVTGTKSQDVHGWLENGDLDMILPMTYTSNDSTLQGYADTYHENSGGRLVGPGIASYIGSVDVGAQIEVCRQSGVEGFCIFDYTSLTANHWAAIDALCPTPVDFPPLPWIDGSPDQVAPALSETEIIGVTGDAATVRWHSDEQTQARLLLSQSGSPQPDVLEPGYGYEHALDLTGLLPTTAYEVVIEASDAAGNKTLSAALSFTTGSGVISDIIVDDGDADYVEVGGWSSGSSAGGYDNDYRYVGSSAQGGSMVRFTPFVGSAGTYDVFVWYVEGANRSSATKFTVEHAAGSTDLAVDQTTNGKQWRYLGTFSFARGNAEVRLTNEGSSGVVVADAVKLTYMGP